MKMIDTLIRQIPEAEIIKELCFQTKDFQGLLYKIADKRHRDVESTDRCYKRLIRDSKRFEKIFHERAGKHLQVIFNMCDFSIVTYVFAISSPTKYVGLC